jgi:hypothetical protein
MNIDELMSVWQSQDASPLHDVNKTLLHLALRQDEAKLQREQRRERWIIYVFSVALVVGMALFLYPMIYRERATGWDFALAIGGTTAAFLTVCAIYLNHRAQLVREQSFGESLRDQLNRRIAQLDDQATGAHRTNVLVILVIGGVCPAAILLFGWRINQKSVSDDGYLLVTLTISVVWAVASGVWALRRSVQRDILPRKRRLEALLKELDAA